jgi:divalent metal cation (Fe/Co/Zn/Cd) transporter
MTIRVVHRAHDGRAVMVAGAADLAWAKAARAGETPNQPSILEPWTPVAAAAVASPELSIQRAAAVTPSERAQLQRRARLLAWGGNAWHLVEFAIAAAAGIAASSIALVGFGIDSLIELAAGSVVVWLFTGRRLHSPTAERRAQQLVAISFLALAAYVAVESIRTLAGSQHPETSWVGIGLAAVTAPTMPLLARAKRRVGRRLRSHATEREAAQNMICAYLSVALLIGLGANALVGWWWADPLAALVIAGIAAREGVEGWRGRSDGCC